MEINGSLEKLNVIQLRNLCSRFKISCTGTNKENLIKILREAGVKEKEEIEMEVNEEEEEEEEEEEDKEEKENLEKCNPDTNIQGEKLDENKTIIMFAKESFNNLECYDYEELKEVIKKQRKLFYWGKGGPDKNKPVFKLTWSGIFIDLKVLELVFTSHYKFIFLYQKEIHKLGSEFGISVTHGVGYQVYSGIEINNFDYDEKIAKSLSLNLTEGNPLQGKFNYIKNIPKFKSDETLKDLNILEQQEYSVMVDENQQNHQPYVYENNILTLQDNMIRIYNSSDIKNLEQRFHINQEYILLITTNIDTLIIDDNNLIKAIGTDKVTTVKLSNMSKIKSIDFSYRALEKIEILNLENLLSINLIGNRISFISLNTLLKIKSIFLYYNQVSDIKMSFERLDNLELLNLTYNKLKEIPESISKLTNLYDLQLNNNEITGLSHIGNLTKLEKLFLQSNKISDLPDDIGNLGNLRELNLDNNDLLNKTDSIHKLTAIKILHLDNNGLDYFPKNIENMKNLSYLSLNENFIEFIPDEIYKLSKLKELYLSNNMLKTLPETITKMGKLIKLDVSDNTNLEIPKSIEEIERLKIIT